MTAFRELVEETGLSASIGQMPIHSGPCGSDFYVDTFRVGYDDVLDWSRLRSSNEGQVAWKDWADILSEYSSFREYNLELFAKVASA